MPTLRLPNMLNRNGLSISRRLITIPIVFIMSIIIIMVSAFYTMNSSMSLTTTIDIAGRQRMLNQRHFQEVLRSRNGDVDKKVDATRKLILSSVNLMIDGGPVGGESTESLAPAPSAELRSLLMEQVALFEQSFSVADKYLSEEATSAAATSHLAELTALVGETHKVANNAVKEYVSHNTSQFSAAKSRMVLIALTTVGLGLAWCLLAIRQTIAPLKLASTQLAKFSQEDLRNVGVSMTTSANETTDRANIASSAAEQVSANANSLAHAVSQFEKSIRDIEGSASNAVDVARDAVEAAQETNAKITRLGESSSEIEGVINAINSIAEQTNLLALNATIEAARAGESGKGFAVVANEVKELANETSKATQEIVVRIDNIQSDTADAVSAISRVTDIISKINESQSAISGAVAGQAEMTSEISKSISEVAIGSGEIASSVSVVAENARKTMTGSEETLVAAASIEKTANQLMQMVGSAPSSY